MYELPRNCWPSLSPCYPAAKRLFGRLNDSSQICEGPWVMNPSLELALAGSLTDHAIKRGYTLRYTRIFFGRSVVIYRDTFTLDSAGYSEHPLIRVGLARWLRSVWQWERRQRLRTNNRCRK
jgi:hypothetical protein